MSKTNAATLSLDKIAEAQIRIAVAFEMVDRALESLTDEESEKVKWDALLDRVEEHADKVKRPKFAALFLKFATRRFRKRYDIPEFGN